MGETVEIALERLTSEAFAPFGQVIHPPAGAPDFAGPHIASWRMDFSADGAIELMVTRYRHLPFALTLMERHFTVTQGFVALGGASSVMVVAGPTAIDGRSPTPEPDSLRAFYVDGSSGVMLWRGAWHALTRFPARPPGAAFALITARETQRELEREKRDGTPPKLTQVADFEKSRGIDFRVVDPRGLLDGG